MYYLSVQRWRWTTPVFSVVHLRSRCYMCLILVLSPTLSTSLPTWTLLSLLASQPSFVSGSIIAWPHFLQINTICFWCSFTQFGRLETCYYGIINLRTLLWLAIWPIFFRLISSKPNLFSLPNLCPHHPVGVLPFWMGKIKRWWVFLFCCEFGGHWCSFCDEAGSYAGDFVWKLPHATNPIMVELMAARDGILWAVQRHW